MRDDIEFNVAFCRLVERHPALYNYMRPDYCNRSVQDKIWRKIGKHLNENAQDCRDRWKNIRARYLKNIKQRSASGDKTVKEYYLAQHLHFLYRFLRRGKASKKKKTSPDSDSRNSDDENVSHEGSQRSISSSPSLTQVLPTVPFITIDGTQRNYHKESYRIDSTLDPDMAFLQSVLPDMKAMRDDQKRKFKIVILNMAGEILEDKPVVRVDIATIKMEETDWENGTQSQS